MLPLPQGEGWGEGETRWLKTSPPLEKGVRGGICEGLEYTDTPENPPKSPFRKGGLSSLRHRGVTVIEIINLTKRYGNITAVSNINLTISDGQFFGFLGPNGAGKTTTIKTLVGLLKPTSGTVKVEGFDVQKQPIQAKRVVGFIPDKPFIYEKLTGKEFLQFSAGLYEVDQNEVDDRITQLLETFELTDWTNELVESYSHGMRQKLVMSAALIHQPKVIVVDEPMVGLDPKGARLVKKIFNDICKKGTTIFMSTHTLEIAEQMCNQIAIIQKGQIIAQGTIEELRQIAKTTMTSLEDIFLELTGGHEMKEVIEFLQT
jgi:ABC-2 type transport system ATP-binding protein